jgi:rhodanese-related sulfurtransferase
MNLASSYTRPMSSTENPSISRRVAPWALIVLIFSTLVGLVTIQGTTPSWGTILSLVRERYPDVRQTNVPDLAAWLADRHRAQPLLLDVRSEVEFEVSHLPGALRVDPRSIPALPPGTALDTPIITYCSVGQRSSATAQRLQNLGYTNVANLEGSIFAWANAGHPVMRSGKEVYKVHPYSARWGRLLSKRLRADLRAEIPE